MGVGDYPPFDPFEITLNAANLSIGGFCCVSLPTSLIPYVTGALEGLKYPSAWHGSDSEVRRAMQIFSTFIAELGSMITACSDNPGNTPGTIGGSDMGCGGCQSTPPVKIEDNILKYWNGCEWLNAGNISGSDSSRGDVEPVRPEAPADKENLQCTKATAIGTMLWKVAGAFDQTMGDTSPKDYISVIESRAGTNLDTAPLTSAVVFWYANLLALELNMTALLSQEYEEQFICKLAPMLDGSTSEITSSDESAIHNALFTLSIMDVVSAGWMAVLIQAINMARFERAIRMAVAQGDSYDCGCPDIETIPVIHEWSKVFNFELGTYGFTNIGDNTHYVAGVGFVCDTLSGGSANMPSVQRQGGHDQPTPCRIKYAKIVYPEWVNNQQPQGGDYKWFHWSGQDLITGAQWIGIDNINAVFGNGVDGEVTSWIRLFGGPYYPGAGNNPYHAVLSKLVIAGDGGDMWSGLQPDGSWA